MESYSSSPKEHIGNEQRNFIFHVVQFHDGVTSQDQGDGSESTVRQPSSVKECCSVKERLEILGWH